MTARVLGMVSARNGDQARATTWLEEALRRCGSVTDQYQWVRAAVLDSMIDLAIGAGDCDRAAELIWETAWMSRGNAAFEGLRPAAGRAAVGWVVKAMAGRRGVDLVVPAQFEAYARIHHRIHNGERWADFAPEYLVRGIAADDDVATRLVFIDGDGNLDAEKVDALVPLLAAETATPNECHFALWEGWGWVHPGSVMMVTFDSDQTPAIERAFNDTMAPAWRFAAACPVEPWWGGRDMILFDGPVEAVSTIGHHSSGEEPLQRQCPQWWWPDDRTWFVGTEIDHPWTYVAGSHRLIDEIVASPNWESLRVESTDRW